MQLNFFFYLLRLRRYKAKCVKTRCLQEGVGHLEPIFQGEWVVPVEYFLVSTKLDNILLSDSANCTVLRAVVLTQYRRVTAVASTSLPMRALRRAVKRGWERRDSVEVGNGGGNGMVGKKGIGHRNS